MASKKRIVLSVINWLSDPQVSLGREMVVSGVITQGRYAGGQGEEFAEQVTVQVSTALSLSLS